MHVRHNGAPPVFPVIGSDSAQSLLNHKPLCWNSPDTYLITTHRLSPGSLRKRETRDPFHPLRPLTWVMNYRILLSPLQIPKKVNNLPNWLPTWAGSPVQSAGISSGISRNLGAPSGFAQRRKTARGATAISEKGAENFNEIRPTPEH